MTPHTDLGMAVISVNSLPWTLHIETTESLASLKNQAYMIKVTAWLNDNEQTSATVEFTIGYSMPVIWEFERMCHTTLTNEAQITDQEYKAGNTALQTTLPPYQEVSAAALSCCPYITTTNATPSSALNNSMYTLTDFEVTVEAPITTEPGEIDFTITVGMTSPEWSSFITTRTFTFRIDITENRCLTLFWSTNEMDAIEEATTLDIFYSTRYSAYIPGMIQLPQITHEATIPEGTCPELKTVLASGDDDFMTNLDDGLDGTYDFASGQQVEHTIEGANLVVG